MEATLADTNLESFDFLNPKSSDSEVFKDQGSAELYHHGVPKEAIQRIQNSFTQHQFNIGFYYVKAVENPEMGHILNLSLNEYGEVECSIHSTFAHEKASDYIEELRNSVLVNENKYFVSITPNPIEDTENCKLGMVGEKNLETGALAEWRKIENEPLELKSDLIKLFKEKYPNITVVVSDGEAVVDQEGLNLKKGKIVLQSAYYADSKVFGFAAEILEGGKKRNEWIEFPIGEMEKEKRQFKQRVLPQPLIEDPIISTKPESFEPNEIYETESSSLSFISPVKEETLPLQLDSFRIEKYTESLFEYSTTAFVISEKMFPQINEKKPKSEIVAHQRVKESRPRKEAIIIQRIIPTNILKLKTDKTADEEKEIVSGEIAPKPIKIETIISVEPRIPKRPVLNTYIEQSQPAPKNKPHQPQIIEISKEISVKSELKRENKSRSRGVTKSSSTVRVNKTESRSRISSAENVETRSFVTAHSEKNLSLVHDENKNSEIKSESKRTRIRNQEHNETFQEKIKKASSQKPNEKIKNEKTIEGFQIKTEIVSSSSIIKAVNYFRSNSNPHKRNQKMYVYDALTIDNSENEIDIITPDYSRFFEAA